MRYVIAVNNEDKFVCRSEIGIGFSSDIEDALLYKDIDFAKIIAESLPRQFTLIDNAHIIPVEVIPSDVRRAKDVRYS